MSEMVQRGCNGAGVQEVFFLFVCFGETASFTKAPQFYIVLHESAISAVMYATNFVLLSQLWDVNPLRTFQQSSPDP